MGFIHSLTTCIFKKYLKTKGRGDVIEGEQAKEVLELLKNDADRTYDNYEMMLNERLDNVSSNRE